MDMDNVTCWTRSVQSAKLTLEQHDKFISEQSTTFFVPFYAAGQLRHADSLHSF
jgi:hypothetical protein